MSTYSVDQLLEVAEDLRTYSERCPSCWEGHDADAAAEAMALAAKILEDICD